MESEAINFTAAQGFNIVARLLDHQVAVEMGIRQRFPERLDDRWT